MTEDEVLKSYIEFLLKDSNIFSKYLILPIGGASNTVALMNINRDKKVFEDEKNVCTVLDGDNVQRKATHKDYSKSIFKVLVKYKIKSEIEIFKIISDREVDKVEEIKQQLLTFLNESETR